MSRGPSQSQRRAAGLYFQDTKKNVCWSITCPLSPVPSSLVRGFQKWGHPRLLVQMLLHVWGSTPHVLKAPQAKQKGTLAVRASPPSFGFPHSPHQLQYTPLPVSPALMAPKAVLSPGLSTSRISCCSCLPLSHLDANTIPETQNRKATLYPRN